MFWEFDNFESEQEGNWKVVAVVLPEQVGRWEEAEFRYVKSRFLALAILRGFHLIVFG